MGKRELRKVDNIKTGKKPTKSRQFMWENFMKSQGSDLSKNLYREAYCSNENQEDQMTAAIQYIASCF